ncbi:MAG: hypothetical protein KGJ43_08365, partial [Acidobacteriota bacterium]|nr:hypothetical protein [Acidobacteriota bacterium]
AIPSVRLGLLATGLPIVILMVLRVRRGRARTRPASARAPRAKADPVAAPIEAPAAGPVAGGLPRSGRLATARNPLDGALA